MLASGIVTIASMALAATASPLQRRANHGRATFYNVGLGNCGGYSSANEHVVALNTAQYGSTSQVSSACGQTISITYNGNTQTATVVDSCPTCPDQALDLSTSLFSALTNGNMGLGQIYVDWSWGSGGSGNSGSSSSSSASSSKSSPSSQASSSSSSSNNNNNNNSNKQSNNDASSSSSSSKPSSTASASSSSATPSNTAQKTVQGTPQWWNVIGNGGCPDVNVPEGVDQVGIAPSTNAEVDTIAAACGKWVQIWNNSNNKTTKAVMTTYLPDGARNNIYLSDAYLKIADMAGDMPKGFTNVTWGFLN